MTARQKALLASIPVCIVLAASAVMGAPSHWAQERERQHVTVIDGDTLKVDGKLIHLYGIDCPELTQICVQNGHEWPCGMSAMLHLDKILTLNRGRLNCSLWGGGSSADGNEESFVCEASHEDLADALLRGGYCVTIRGAFPGYVEAERAARKGHLGIWGSDFLSPSEWRRQQKRPEAKP